MWLELELNVSPIVDNNATGEKEEPNPFFCTVKRNMVNP